MIGIDTIKKAMVSIAEKVFRSPHRTLLFGIVGLLFCLVLSIANIVSKLYVSGSLLLLLSLIISVILFLDLKGFKRYVRIAYVVFINLFIVLIVFVQGLATGAHLFLIPLLVALAFLLDNLHNYKRQVAKYFGATVFSYLLCLLTNPMSRNFDHISPKLYHDIFFINSVIVILLISVFTFIGVTIERKARRALIMEKDRAKAQSGRISMQNKNLREIAFMSAHNVRSPLTNIMSIVQMINVDNITAARDKQLISYLKQSATELDGVIHDIIEKTTAMQEDKVS